MHWPRAMACWRTTDLPSQQASLKSGSSCLSPTQGCFVALGAQKMRGDLRCAPGPQLTRCSGADVRSSMLLVAAGTRRLSAQRSEGQAILSWTSAPMAGYSVPPRWRTGSWCLQLLKHVAHPDGFVQLLCSIGLLLRITLLDRCAPVVERQLAGGDLVEVGAQRLHPVLRPQHDMRHPQRGATRAKGGDKPKVFALIAKPVDMAPVRLLP